MYISELIISEQRKSKIKCLHITNTRNFNMDDKLKADISKIIDEAVSSKLSNQQATLTFNLENIDAKDRLKKMLNVDKYDMVL